MTLLFSITCMTNFNQINKIVCFVIKINITRMYDTFVQLGPRSKQSLSLKVWTKDEH